MVTAGGGEHEAAVYGKGVERRSKWKENEQRRAGKRLSERMLKV